MWLRLRISFTAAAVLSVLLRRAVMLSMIMVREPVLTMIFSKRVDEVIVIAGKLTLAAGGGVDDNAVKIWRKGVNLAVGAGIALGKLRGAQLKIEIQHRFGLLLHGHIAHLPSPRLMASPICTARIDLPALVSANKDAQFAFKPQVAKRAYRLSGSSPGGQV
jgi:hypothetical protein